MEGWTGAIPETWTKYDGGGPGPLRVVFGMSWFFCARLLLSWAQLGHILIRFGLVLGHIGISRAVLGGLRLYLAFKTRNMLVFWCSDSLGGRGLETHYSILGSLNPFRYVYVYMLFFVGQDGSICIPSCSVWSVCLLRQPAQMMGRFWAGWAQPFRTEPFHLQGGP